MKKRLFTSILLMMVAMALPSSVWADTETYDFTGIDGNPINQSSDNYAAGTELYLLASAENNFGNRFAIGPKARIGNAGFYFRNNDATYKGLYNGYSDREFSILNLKVGDKVTLTISNKATTLSFVDGNKVVSETEYTVEADGNMNFVSTGSVYIEKVVIETKEDNKPVISQNGNIVTITAKSGYTTYYTLDGSEPTTSTTTYFTGTTKTLALGDGCTVKAFSVKDGITGGTIVTDITTFAYTRPTATAYGKYDFTSLVSESTKRVLVDKPDLSLESNSVSLNYLKTGSNTFDYRFAVGPKTNQEDNRQSLDGDVYGWAFNYNSSTYKGLYAQYNPRNLSILDLKDGDMYVITTSKDEGTLGVVSGQLYTKSGDGNVDLTTTGSVYIESIVIGTTSQQLAIACSPGNNGAITTSKADNKALPTEKVTITVTPNNGYSIKASSIKVNNVEVSSSLITTVAATGVATFTLTMPDTAPTVSAEFISNAPSENTITFDSEGGSTVTAITAAAGASITWPENPTKNGYDFVGWFAEGASVAYSPTTTMPTESITLTAHWTAIAYTITYNLGSESDITNNNPTSYTIESEAITLSAPTWEGKTFNGWKGTDNTGDLLTSVTIAQGSTGNKEFTAHWAGTISFASNTVTKTVGDGAFTNALTNNGDGTVTYSIEAGETGATINTSTGEVTLGSGTGTATITATVDNGTNFDYATTTAAYTLTVNAKAAEETISTAKTWTFDSGYTTGDYYANNSNSYTAVDGLYARSLSTRKFVITACSEITAYSFTDGTSGSVTNYAKISGTYEGTNSEVTSAAQNSGYLTPFFAFNTSVAGTCYAYVKSSGESNQNVRIYYTSGNGSFNCPSGAYTTSSTAREIKQTASAGGTFFIGSTTNAVGEIYAIRFVPTHTLTFAADPADKATITIKDGNTALTSGSAIEEGKTLTIEVSGITEGYEVDNVKVNNGGALTADANGKYTFTMPTANATVTVTLKLKSYNLTAAQATNGSISFTVGGQAATTAKMGDEVTVVATPDTNYQLSTLAATPNTVTISDNKFTMPDYDVTVSATFKESSTTPVVTDYYGNYTFRTWASGTDYLSTAGAFSLERGNDGLLSGRAYWKDGDNTVYSQAMPLNSKFSANSGYVQFRKHSDERYQGLYVSESDFNKSQSSITLTINNLKANDWVKITSTENALTFQNSAAKALADYSADIANQVLVSDAYYVISADNTDLPLTFGNSSTGSYIYNIEIGSDELVPAPVISYAEDTHKATITGYSSTKGNTVTVTYSTDEGATWTTYSEGITIPTVGTTTVWAKSTTTGQKESALAKKVISGIQQTIEAPTIAVSGTMVTITQGTASDTSTEVITWYTLDNSDPTDASNTNRKQYESPFTLTATAYIKAYSVYNDAIGVASDVTTYTDKVRVGTFTAEKNVFDFKALAGDFGSLTFNETAVTLKEVYNNATEEKSFNAITNTDYFTKSDNDASVLLRAKTGNELSQAAGGLTGKDGRGYLAVSGLATGKRVVVEFAGGKVKYVTGTGEGEVTVDGIQLERNADVTSGKAMTITEGSYIVLFNANGTTITKISVLDAAVMRNVSIATGILNGQVVADQSSVGDGETVTLTVTPAEGYELDQLIATGGAAISKGTAENTYTFTMPNSNVTVSATFKAISASTEEPTVTEYVAVNAAGDAATVTGVDIAEGATSITISGKAGNIDVTDIDAGTFTAENTANVGAIDLSATKVAMTGERTEIPALKNIDASTLIYLPSTANVTGTNVVVKSGTGDTYTCSDFEVDNGKLENGKSVVVPKEFKADKVTLKRTFTADKKCTVCLPYAFTAAGGTFYKFNGISEGKVQMLAQTAGATLEANTPYIFMPNSTTEEAGNISTTASGDNKILVAIADAKTADTSTSFTFKGTYEAINWTEKPTKPIYGFAAEDKDGSTVGTFVKIGAGASIKACRAYLEYEGNSTPGSIAETRGMNDLPDVLEIEWIPASGKGTTGIEDARRAADDSEAVYNMRGQRVDKNYKGLVIVNGKKVVRK